MPFGLGSTYDKGKCTEGEGADMERVQLGLGLS